MASVDDHALALGKELIRIWEDQAAFNLLFRQPPTNDLEMAEQVRDFVVYTESELHELMRTMSWKKHRNAPVLVNHGHRQDEVADVFKCVLSLLQITGQTPETLFASYWDKTAVVRQRYQEEWVRQINQPCAIIDIDNVLCDYITGILRWLHRHDSGVPEATLQRLADEGAYVNAETLGIPDERWKRLKHEFRVSGGKRYLSAFGGATSFLRALKERGLQIVILTSRPVDRYPNIYTDTLLWLERNDLPFDFIWWATDKGERVIEGGLRQHAKLFVDDERKYVDQMIQLKIPTYWMRRDGFRRDVDSPLVHTVNSFQQIVDHYDFTRDGKKETKHA